MALPIVALIQGPTISQLAGEIASRLDLGAGAPDAGEPAAVPTGADPAEAPAVAEPVGGGRP